MDVKGTFEVARTAVSAQFLLRTFFDEEDASIWYHAQHRAFIETVRPSHSPYLQS